MSIPSPLAMGRAAASNLRRRMLLGNTRTSRSEHDQLSDDSSKVILEREFYFPELIAECRRRFVRPDYFEDISKSELIYFAADMTPFQRGYQP